MVFVLEAKSAQTLKRLSSENKTSMTKLLEAMILEHEKPSDSQNKWLKKSIALMQEHKNLYMGLNATFSNLNQIARHLNMNAFAGDGIHEALLIEIQTQVQNCTKQIGFLRILVLKNMALLGNKMPRRRS
ncbi:hypothetical protein NHP190020_18140 (plasmid) [Helicobacter suis]|nr:hypothetical protein NHP190020_18140 [Helicobacter suis]BDR29108.1 hypothetical protein HSHS1_18690 [Helicobacter suis HS1]BDR29140.1 hypothetical protein HSHS1_19010 [Helicobacter suis HS1]GFK17133.1 hypothetical protein NHP190033_13090 [Helicobacter suis]CRF49678.1 FIG00711098: hypothetical protein [Helicobacter heilmannii]